MADHKDDIRAEVPGSRALVMRLLRDYLRPHLWRIVVALFCMAVVALSTAAFTQLIKPIVNDIFVARQSAMLWPVAAACLVVFVAKGLAAYGQAVLMSFVAHRLVADVQSQLFDRMTGLDLAFFHQHSPGQLVSRFIADTNVLRGSVSNTLTAIGKDSLTLMALVGVMFYEDWRLAFVAFFAFPCAIWPIITIGRRMRKVTGKAQGNIARLTTVLDEFFQGVRQVKAYAMEAYERRRARQAIDDTFAMQFKGERTRNLLHPIMETLGGLAVVAVILYGGHLVIIGAKDPGAFFAFIFALLLAYEPMKRLAKLNARLQEGLAAAERVFALMDEEPTIRELPEALELRVDGGAIRFRGVSFSYDGVKGALRDLSLEVPAGRTVALVGHSGAGKSTILNLIPRFYDVDAGSVEIDGQDLRRVGLESLRRQIALVSQEILLFDDTIRANIAYGDPTASDEAVRAAARNAGADDFIEDLPNGYDTLVGPRGSKLSGGQRQRIAIARAMLKNAPILLLDEATSSLDSETERRVQDALSKLMAGRTTLVIAHRLSTVMDADVIYVLDQGRIVESGRHGALLAGGGAYARLHALQFADQGDVDDASPAVELRA